LLLSVTAVLAPVFSLAALLKVTVPPVLFCTRSRRCCWRSSPRRRRRPAVEIDGPLVAPDRARRSWSACRSTSWPRPTPRCCLPDVELTLSKVAALPLVRSSAGRSR
jgi:hypothetical protein